MKVNITKNKSILITFLVPYIIILSIPMIVGSIAYTVALNITTENVEKYNMAILEQTSQVLDTRINEIEGVLYEYMSNTKVANFLYQKDPIKQKKISSVIETRDSLYNYSLYNKFILGTFVFFKKSNLVLARDFTEYSNIFYDDDLSYINMKYDEFYNKLFYDRNVRTYWPEQEVNYKSKRYSVITFVQNIGNSSENSGAIVLLVNNNEIKQLLSGLDISGGGIAYITDENNNIISMISTNEDEINIEDINISEDKFITKQKVNGENMLVTCTTSSFNKWKYISVQPYYIVMDKVLVIKKATWIMFMLILIVGILLSYYLARKNSQPILNIVEDIRKIVGKDINDTNNYEFIKNGIKKLMDNSDIMNLALNEQKIMLRSQIYNRILKGDFKTEKEIKKLLTNLGDKAFLDYDNYAVIIAGITAYDKSEDMSLEEMEKKRIAFREIIISKSMKNSFISDIDKGKTLILTGFNGDISTSKDKIKEIIGFIDNTALDTLGIEVTYYIGDLYEQLSNIFKSYQEAFYIIGKLGHRSTEKIQWFNENNNKSKLFYYYPTEIESRLINCTKSGEKDEVNKILDELCNENMINRKLTPIKIKTFSYELWGTLLKVIQDINIEDENICNEINEVDRNIHKYECNMLIDKTIKLYNLICDDILTKKRSNNKILKDKLVNYIEENYFDPDLSLTILGEKFEFSNVYLSHFFKEQTGESFSKYLENVRMTNAQILLDSTNLQVNEISQKVGYYTSATFCRAYKRRNGISPNNSRKK